MGIGNILIFYLVVKTNHNENLKIIVYKVSINKIQISADVDLFKESQRVSLDSTD